MKFGPQPHHRHSIRLKGYDYRDAAAYFVTICTQDGECIFEDPAVRSIIAAAWLELPMRFTSVELDEFVVMPNHVHFILWLGAPPVGAGVNPAPTLGAVVGAFKSLVFKGYRDWVRVHDAARPAKFWQRNYYEHIIRNARELDAIRQYIIDNPANWERDRDAGPTRDGPTPWA